jgi:hypothetical protein
LWESLHKSTLIATAVVLRKRARPLVRATVGPRGPRAALRRTGRHTYIGNCLWSEPQCLTLSANAQTLFDGSLTPTAARSFVLVSGARFVLADCQTTADMRTLLHPIIRSAHRFGCAAVYDVDTG